MARSLWYELDLRTPNAFGYPAEDKLCALYMVDRNSHRDEYQIGHFFREGKKLWWKDGAGSVMRRRCIILWSYVEPPGERR